jgi:RNA polymerase sigma-70 factor (ECF subfamily)
VEPVVTRLSLLSRVRDPADQAAWTEFERRYHDLIRHYALARGLQFCDAEDVCQVVFLRLSRYLRNFRYQPGRGRFRSYLGAVVRNVVNTQLACPECRTRPVDEAEDAAFGLPDPGPQGADELWEREWMEHHYRRALQAVRSEVDARSVAVFERLIAGDSLDAVAEAHGMSLDAVEKVRQRIRTRMQAAVAEQIREEDAD